LTRKLPKATTRTLPQISEGETVDAGKQAAPAKPIPAASVDTRAELRRAEAQAIVDRHTTYAAVGGLVPIPFVDTVGLIVIVTRMVRALALHFDQPTEPERLRMVAAAVVGGVAPPLVSGTIVSGFARMMPATMLFSAALSSVTAVALTRTIGRAFIRHFEGEGTLDDFDVERFRKERQRSPG
jgi:uncharacterized protein (DUF697 family)